ncbi:MAG TPA: pitrilysin family protein [Methylomirabilota bacterium]|nr:pitrilysin family protein [Methylomirabilota bacterium]
MIRAALALLVIAALVAPAAAATDTTREQLGNGLTVLVRENPVAPVVAVSLMVKTGTWWETPTNNGISNFVHAVMVRGTTQRSGSQLAEAIAALGGKISASGEVDYSEIRASALSRFWRELLGFTAELALTPKLASGELDGERDWVMGRIQKRRDSAPSRAFDEFFATLYGPHPYSLQVLGTPESLRRIDHAALVEWYRRSYRPERMTLSVSGQVSAAQVLAEARRLFGELPRGGAATETPRPSPANPGTRRVIEQAAQQAQILAGGIAPSLSHPDHAPVKVLSTILGGGMAGRLFVELRDKRGLAYTAASYYDPVRDPGALILYLGTAPENATKAEEELRREIERIRTDPVSDDELRRAKGYLLGRYTMDRRTNERQAWYLAFYEQVGVGQDYPERYRRAVEAVTPADVRRVAKQYLEKVTTVVLRPR